MISRDNSRNTLNLPFSSCRLREERQNIVAKVRNIPKLQKNADFHEKLWTSKYPWAAHLRLAAGKSSGRSGRQSSSPVAPPSQWTRSSASKCQSARAGWLGAGEGVELRLSRDRLGACLGTLGTRGPWGIPWSPQGGAGPPPEKIRGSYSCAGTHPRATPKAPNQPPPQGVF